MDKFSIRLEIHPLPGESPEELAEELKVVICNYLEGRGFPLVKEPVKSNPLGWAIDE